MPTFTNTSSPLRSADWLRRRTSFPPGSFPTPNTFNTVPSTAVGTAIPTTTLHRVLASEKTATLLRRPSLSRSQRQRRRIASPNNTEMSNDTEDFLQDKGDIVNTPGYHMTPPSPRTALAPLPSPTKVQKLAKRQIKEDYRDMHAQKELRRASRSKRKSVFGRMPSLDSIGEDADHSYDSYATASSSLDAIKEDATVHELDGTSSFGNFKWMGSSETLVESPEEEDSGRTFLRSPSPPLADQQWTPQKPLIGEVPDPLRSHPIDPEELTIALNSRPYEPFSSASDSDDEEMSPHFVSALSFPDDSPTLGRFDLSSPSSLNVEPPYSRAASPYPCASIPEAVTPRPSVSAPTHSLSTPLPGIPELEDSPLQRAATAPEPEVVFEPATPTHVKGEGKNMMDAIMAAHGAVMARRGSGQSDDLPVSPAESPIKRKPLPSTAGALEKGDEAGARGRLDSIRSSEYDGNEEDERELEFGEAVGMMKEGPSARDSRGSIGVAL